MAAPRPEGGGGDSFSQAHLYRAHVELIARLNSVTFFRRLFSMSRRPDRPRLKLARTSKRAPGRTAGGRIIPPEPRFERLPPSKPATLSAEASAHWDVIVDGLQPHLLLKPVDQGSLTNLCEIWARISKCRSELARDGLTTRTASGGIKAHPAVTMLQAAEREYRVLASHFGLTPQSEGVLKPPPDDSKAAEYNPFV